MTEEDPYLCVGVCMTDPDSGYCIGCGRPPPPVGAVVAEPVPRQQAERLPGSGDPDTPDASDTLDNVPEAMLSPARRTR